MPSTGTLINEYLWKNGMKVGVVIIPVFQMKKLRLKMVNEVYKDISLGNNKFRTIYKDCITVNQGNFK